MPRKRPPPKKKLKRATRAKSPNLTPAMLEFARLVMQLNHRLDGMPGNIARHTAQVVESEMVSIVKRSVDVIVADGMRGTNFTAIMQAVLKEHMGTILNSIDWAGFGRGGEGLAGFIARSLTENLAGANIRIDATMPSARAGHWVDETPAS